MTEADEGRQVFRNRFLITGTILGRGALAGVNLAYNVETGEQVACKVHRLDRFRQLQDSPSTIRRILDETNILSRLTHASYTSHEALCPV